MTIYNDYRLQQQITEHFENHPAGEGGGNANVITGSGIFTASGTATLYHGFNHLGHYTYVSPGGTDEFDDDALAQVGEIYIQVGLNEDIAYTTGGATASGFPYIWMAVSSSGTNPASHDETTYGVNADVRLERTSTSGIQLVGVEGSSKHIWVYDTSIPVTTAKTLETNSAEHFVVSGTETVWKADSLATYVDNDYQNYGLHYVYLANDNSCWQFSGYDRRRQLFISPAAPTEEGGYLCASGNGMHARHVGWTITSGTYINNDLFVSSIFNSNVDVFYSKGTSDSSVSMPIESEIIVENCWTHCIIPKNWSLHINGRDYIRHQSSDAARILLRINLDGVTEAESVVWVMDDNGVNLDYVSSDNISFSYKSDSTSVVKIDLAIYNSYSVDSPTYVPTACAINMLRLSPSNIGGSSQLPTLDCIECVPSGVVIHNNLTASSGTFTEGISVGTGTVHITGEGITLPNSPALTSLDRFYKTVVGGRLERYSDTELRWEPYESDTIGLWNGSGWELVCPSGVIQAFNDFTTISGSAAAIDTNYDVYATYESSDNFILEFQEWAGDVSRYQDPVRFEGVYVYEDNEAGKKKRWLGIVRLRNDSGNKFTDDRYRRFIFNKYNQVEKTLKRDGVTDSWSNKDSQQITQWTTFDANSWLGLITDGNQYIRLQATGEPRSSNGTNAVMGISMDSSSNVSSDSTKTRYRNTDTALSFTSQTVEFTGKSVAGYHYWYPLVYSTSSSASFYINYENDSNGHIIGSFIGTIRC